MVRTAWLRRTASYGVTAIMACFGLTSVASAQTITNTGPGSHNNITSNQTNNCQVTNNNDLSVYNRNNQYATTGSASESDNTNAGASWSGWSTLDPAAAQAAGLSYTSWWSGVVNWIAQRAGGSGWNSSNASLTWTPGSTDWASFDPLTWQANGQSFANWYNAVESYLNNNSSNWVLSWPTTDTGTGSFGATSGNATNNYNANFSININNAARAAAGTNACGQSLFTPPATGGSGGGSLPSGGSSGVVLGSSFASASRPTEGNGGGGFVGGSAFIPTSHVSRPALSSSSVLNTSPVISTPTGGSGGGGGAPAPAPAASISNTGPGSSNNITSNQTNNSSVTNCNTVTVSSTNTQVATTGSSNVSDNTTTGGGGSGNATNTGSSGTGVGISN